jgi:hypothetical protein
MPLLARRAEFEDEAALHGWCVRWLGAAPADVLFRRGHLSVVFGLRLADGRQVVVKIRPAAERIAGCVAAQRYLFEAGFPCPRPLAGPAPLGDGSATAEELVPGGGALAEEAGDAHGLPAALLVDLVRLAPHPSVLPSLDPAPPWVGWAHGGPGIWPRPDDLDLDMNDHPGPPWIDETASRLRERLAVVDEPVVVGHLDWESHNIRWRGHTPLAVDDWDSVATMCEPAVAGAAATVYPSSPDGRIVAATVDQTGAFLDSYQRVRGTRWPPRVLEVCWAAGLWVLTYNAKKETLGGGGGYVAHLRREIEERLRRSGA